MHIYKITNLIDGKSYIGKSVREQGVREKEHLSGAKIGSETHPHFYRAIRKYGVENFSIEILYQTDSWEDLNWMETQSIVRYRSYLPEFGYNLTLGGEGLGIPTEETRNKMRITNRENAKKLKHSPERKIEVSEFFKNIPRTSAWRSNISVALMGHKVSQETKQKISDSKQNLSPETHVRMSTSAKQRQDRIRGASGRFVKKI